jgi:heptaprenyl diphosphate synthase
MNGSLTRLTRLALLLALATVIHTAEALLPVTVGWFRFGFANIISVATLYLFGWKDALALTMGRVFLGSLVTGMFGSPAFLLSLAGGLSAVLGMAMVVRFFPRVFSEIGVSVVGAVLHNLAQLLVAYLVLVRNDAVLVLLPFMMLAATITGVLNGLAAHVLIVHFRKTNPDVSRRSAVG